jgi:hypothetical protein
LRFTGALAEKAPRFAGWGLAVAEALADGPREVAIVGERGEVASVGEHGEVASVGERGTGEPGTGESQTAEPETSQHRAFRELHQAALRSTAPGLVIAVTPPTGAGQSPEPENLPELLSDRPTIAGEPAAYVCRGFVCQAPTTDLNELAEQLS